MCVATRSLLRCRSTSKLLERAATFLSTHAGQSEILILAPTRAAAHELTVTAFQHGCQGIHAFTLIQLAAHIAAQPMGRRALAPLSRLGIDRKSVV